MGRRTLLLITSILVAAIGTALVGLYVRGADARATENQELVEVFVAAQTIDPGTPGNNGLFSSISIPRKYRVEGAITNIGQTAGKVAVAKIVANQQISTEMFGKATDVTNTSGIASGHVGVAVQLSDPARAAGSLALNTRVAIYATLTPQGGDQRITVLLPEVKVVGIGSTSLGDSSNSQNGQQGGTGRTQQVPTTNVLLDLQPTDAPKVILANQAGELYFAILGEKTTVPPGKILSVADLLKSS